MAAINAATNEQLFALQKTDLSGNELFLNGMGEVKKLNSDYFVAALYLKEKNTIDTDIIYLEEPKRLIMRFALDKVSARGFGRELAGALKINNVPEEITAYRNDLRDFINLFRGLYDKGDTITIDYEPKRGVTVKHNNKVLGSVKKQGFDKLVFKAILGEKPMSTTFKSGLIGGNDDKYAIELLRKYVDM